MRRGIWMMASFGRCPELAFGLSPFRRILHAALDERFFTGVVAGDDVRAAAFGEVDWLAAGGVAGLTSAGILEDHRQRHVRIFRREVGDRCAAHRVPHQNRLVQLQFFDEAREILDLNIGRIRRRRWIGQAVATRVEHDDVEVLLKLPRQIGPAQSIVGRAVREYQHRLVPSGAPVVDADSVRLHITVRPSGRRWGTRGKRQKQEWKDRERHDFILSRDAAGANYTTLHHHTTQGPSRALRPARDLIVQLREPCTDLPHGYETERWTDDGPGQQRLSGPQYH